jgi:hypothetical protein
MKRRGRVGSFLLFFHFLHGFWSSRFEPQRDGSHSHVWPHAVKSTGTSVGPKELSSHGPPPFGLSDGAGGNNA